MKRTVNLNKAFGFTVGINALQVLMAFSVAVFSIASGGSAFTGIQEQLLLCGVALIVSWGAALDIREAFHAKKIYLESDMLEAAYTQMEALNGTLRAQRHDFMNHLQVVFSLIEMNDYPSAGEYIERVYSDIQKVGRALKTAHPSINALLAAKLSDCESKNIALSLVIESPGQSLPVNGWEMCRVLGNLIDNAIDALHESPSPEITVHMSEDLHAFKFSVSNNGPSIPPAIQAQIYQRGFSTKGKERGMGLAIVSEILEQHGGRIALYSTESKTEFSGTVKKAQDAALKDGE